MILKYQDTAITLVNMSSHSHMGFATILQNRVRRWLMNKKYYIQNMGWGWFMGALLLYSYLGSELKYKSLMLFISVAGIVIFPFAKWAVESFFLMFTTREFWDRGLFMDTPAKMGGLALYHGFIFCLSIPITITLVITIFIKRWLVTK